MFQTVAAHLVAEREQEVVMVVVMRAVELVHLLHERTMDLHLLRRDLQILRIVGDDVHVHRRAGTRIEIDALEIFAGVDRRVDEVVVIDRLEVHGVAIFRSDLQAPAELPARRQLHARIGLDLARVVTGRIQRHCVPLQIEHFRRHHHAALAHVLRRQILELDFHRRGALRHIHVEGVDVVLIAHPRQRLAVGLHRQAGELVDRTGRRMVARNPLWIEQVSGPGAAGTTSCTRNTRCARSVASTSIFSVPALYGTF
jgi:hypothetical protein